MKCLLETSLYNSRVQQRLPMSKIPWIIQDTILIGSDVCTSRRKLWWFKASPNLIFHPRQTKPWLPPKHQLSLSCGKCSQSESPIHRSCFHSFHMTVKMHKFVAVFFSGTFQGWTTMTRGVFG